MCPGLVSCGQDHAAHRGRVRAGTEISDGARAVAVPGQRGRPRQLSCYITGQHLGPGWLDRVGPERGRELRPVTAELRGDFSAVAQRPELADMQAGQASERGWIAAGADPVALVGDPGENDMSRWPPERT